MDSTVRNISRSTLAALSLLLAACGQSRAEPAADESPESSRQDYTLGQVIAEQGNQALRQIRKDSARVALPELPKADAALAGDSRERDADVAAFESDELEAVRARARMSSMRPDVYRPVSTGESAPDSD